MKSYQWAVIGAGPAGIAAVGKLLEYGVSGQDILWIDPYFEGGDFARLWADVPSNTKVARFLHYFNAPASFQYHLVPAHFRLNNLSPDDTCLLSDVAESLLWVTSHLRQEVTTRKDLIKSIYLADNCWYLESTHFSGAANNVVLAIGAEPKELLLPQGLQHIALKQAMSEFNLQQVIDPDDTVAVFGSSHSAILVLKNLINIGVKQIYNFYRSPLRYAVELEEYILFDDTGLKGPTAVWARTYLDGKLPVNLTRIYSTEENINHCLPYCNKAIVAIGFERRCLPVIQEIGYMEYIEECGIIAPGLFGFGIAFPEAKINPLGFKEYRVGLRKFIDYLERVMPIWLRYPA